MKTLLDLNVELYTSIDRFNRVLEHIYPKSKVVYDLTMKRAEVYKDGLLIKLFDMKNATTAGQWGAIEGNLWHFLGDLTLELSFERMKKETIKNPLFDDTHDPDEDIPF